MKNIKIIKEAAKDSGIQISPYYLVTDPVPTLEELDFWVKRLETIGEDYTVARFDRLSTSKYDDTYKYRRKYGIFSKFAHTYPKKLDI
jgi:hypothetical protein